MTFENCFDIVIFLLVAIASYLLRMAFPDSIDAIRRTFTSFAARRWWAVTAMAVLGLLGSALLVVLFGIPLPRSHDESSYLLAGDTFAGGRLTNPAHPLWTSFETFHVNQQPTYHSIYPPGQGSVLALGQAVTGRPIVGVWISMAAACGAICWMFQAWLPGRWALFAAIVASLKLIFTPYPAQWMLQPGYWSHSYWGGAVAALGGALLFGSVGRLARSPGAGTSITFGLGCFILANSRPFEGFVAVVFSVLYLAFRMLDLQLSWKLLLRRFFLPLFVVVVPSVIFMLFYDITTTGRPLIRPYDLNSSMYAITPVTLLQPLKPEPAYRHDRIRRYHQEWAVPRFLKQQSVPGFVQQAATKLQKLWYFFFGPLFVLPLLLIPFTLTSSASRFAFPGCLIAMGALAPMPWLEPHYFAPVAGLFYLLIAQSIRFVAALKCNRSALVAIVAPAFVVSLGISTAITVKEFANADRSQVWSVQRASVIESLSRLGSTHLVLVTYAPDNSGFREWVCNAADIDAAPVVWARESNEDQTNALIDYFAERQVWRLRISSTGFDLVSVPRKAGS